MTNFPRMLAITALASLALSGAAFAQAPSGATNARDAMMEEGQKDCSAISDPAMKKDCEMKKDEMMKKEGMMKKDEMMKKDGMSKDDMMKKK